MPISSFVGFPKVFSESGDDVTVPMALQELPRQVQFDRAVSVINRCHVRVAKSIKIFWGHHGCAEYLQSLILCGGDGFDHERVGFAPDVMTALLELARLAESSELENVVNLRTNHYAN